MYSECFDLEAFFYMLFSNLQRNGLQLAEKYDNWIKVIIDEPFC